MLSSVLLRPPTGRTNKPNKRKSPRKRCYSNYRNIEKGKGLPAPRDWKRLKEAGAIKEAFFQEWLANTVVLKKKNGKWRVCVDFTDLNRTCPKDLFPMLKIDQLVDATYGHSRMSFLDAF